MKTEIGYSEIPIAERKRLSAIAFRHPLVCSAFFAGIFIPTLLSNALGKYFEPAGASFLVRAAVRFAIVFIGMALVWALFARRLLRAEIVRLKNA
jgi:hypothetical protein